MNKKFTISIPNAYEAPRKDQKKTELSDEDNSHPVRGDHYIEESQSEDERSDRPHKSNDKSGQAYPLVEFEEFTIQRKPTVETKDRKKRYEIEVPQIKFDHANSHVKREPDNDDVFKDYICKEPPAPNKGSSKAKVFVFPTTQPAMPPAAHKDKPARYGQTTATTPNNQHIPERHQRLETGANEDISKERQRYERELLVKDAQIDMLQKIIGEHLNMKYQFSSVHEAERILVEKDLRHTQLLDKMQQMSAIVKSKNDEIAHLKYDNERLQCALESMQHNIYLLTKKDQNMKLTREFHELRQQPDEDRHSKSFWEEDRRSSLKQDGCLRNIEDLQKRLDFLKSNRIELEASKSRQKNKSVLTSMPKQEVLWCSMTSKHRPKGTFDFKFQKERSNDGSFLEKGKKKELY